MPEIHTSTDLARLLVAVIAQARKEAAAKGHVGQPELAALAAVEADVKQVDTELPLSIYLSMVKVRLLALEEETEEGGNEMALARVAEVIDALDEARRVAGLD